MQTLTITDKKTLKQIVVSSVDKNYIKNLKKHYDNERHMGVFQYETTVQ